MTLLFWSFPPKRLYPKGRLCYPTLVPAFSHTHTASATSQRNSAHSQPSARQNPTQSESSTAPRPCCVEPHRNKTHSTSVGRRKGGIPGDKREVCEGNAFSIRGISYRMQTRKHHYSRSYYLIEFHSFILPSMYYYL